MSTQVLRVVILATPLIAALLWALIRDWRETLALLAAIGFCLLYLAALCCLIAGLGIAMGLGVPW